MKSKKIILSVFLALVLSASSFMLFGCAKKTSSANVYKLFDESITAIKEDVDSPFTKGTINYIETNFDLQDMTNKAGNGSTVQLSYNHYRTLAAVGLNFIEKYYPLLEDNNIKADYSKLESSIKDLNKKYDTLKEEHEKFNSLKDTNADYSIYNGFFYNYKNSAYSFINSTFDCANRLGKFLNNEAKLAKNVGSESMDNEGLEFYLDYNYLNIYGDFKLFFFDSCEGEPLDLTKSSSEFTLVNLSMANFGNVVMSKMSAKKDDLVNLLADEMEYVITIFSSLDSTRGDARKAMNKFSFYNFANSYDNDINAYKKVNSFANVYYDRVLNYFVGENSAIYRVATFLQSSLAD